MHKGQKMPEYLKKQHSEWMKNNAVSYWKGKKKGPLSETTKKRLSKAQRKAWKEGRRKIHPNTLNNVQSLNKGKFGKAHPKWTDNKKHPFYKAIRSLHEYNMWRMQIFKRDSWTCTLCGDDGYVEADHYPKRFIDIIRDNKVSTIIQAINCEELWEAEGRTLCRLCHLNASRLS